VKPIRPIWRFLYFAFYTFIIVAEIWLRNRLQGVEVRRAMLIRRRWANHLLKGIGVELNTFGEAPNSPCIIVANHRSYLDPILMLREVDAYPVAKAELANWPVIGKGAKLAGILYLKRESVKSRAGTLIQIQQVIDAGFPVLIFPEGTTSGLPGALPFKKGIFQMAAKAQIQVVPVAVCFKDARDFWVGRESFLKHAARRFQEKSIQVTLHYGPPMLSDNPESLRINTQAWIEEKLLTIYPNAHL
jgi:1-acyl-sn-glycerol-3-phosphate acyltransferase